MFMIEMDLLAGRYGATAFDDRNSSEWPPHPARLFSAMVASWAEDPEPSDQEKLALRWFESLPPPTIAGAGELSRRAVVTHYVPVNDARSTARDIGEHNQRLLDAEAAVARASGEKAMAKARGALAKAKSKARSDSQAVGRSAADATPGVIEASVSVLPEARGRQGRTFPAIRLPDRCRTVRFSWPRAEPAEDTVAALDAVLSRIGRLGHSATPVSCRVVGESEASLPRGAVTWSAIEAGVDAGPSDPALIRLPAAGSLDRLTAQFAVHGGSGARSAPARFAWYRAGGDDTSGKAPVTSALAGPWRVLRIRSGSRVLLSRTLDLTRAVRAALLSGSEDAPYVLHGHVPGAPGLPTPAGTEPHLTILPLANVGSPRSDGTVHGVALMLPFAATSVDFSAVDTALARWHGRAEEDGLPLYLGNLTAMLDDLGFDFTGSGAARSTILTRWYWSRAATSWSSVTPVALDRYPGPVRDPQWESRAGEIIAVSCTRVGLPVPDEVEIVWGIPMVGVPSAGPAQRRQQPKGPRFAGYRSGSSGQLRLCVHARLHFAEAVSGPLLIGAGRFSGYGLFLPAPPSRRPQ